jgi:hypothetical protein
VGLEETSLVEQRDSSPASLRGGSHDLFRFSIVGQLIPASTRQQATVTITRRSAFHAPSVMKRPGESNGVDKLQGPGGRLSLAAASLLPKDTADREVRGPGCS